MLATLIVVVKQSTYAVSLNTTDDGLSVAGIFFAKLETLQAKQMSGEIGKAFPIPHRCVWESAGVHMVDVDEQVHSIEADLFCSATQ
jgi:hypothetical protein